MPQPDNDSTTMPDAQRGGAPVPCSEAGVLNELRSLTPPDRKNNGATLLDWAMEAGDFRGIVLPIIAEHARREAERAAARGDRITIPFDQQALDRMGKAMMEAHGPFVFNGGEVTDG